MRPASSYRKAQCGISLIELMISLVVGLIILAATITTYLLIFKVSVQEIRYARLNYDVSSLLLLMKNDLRRSGFSLEAVSESKPTANPFTTSTTDLIINNDWDGNGNSCVTYSYDVSNPGSDAVVDSSEIYGFRRAQDGTVSIRISGTDASVANSCSDGDGTWENLNVIEGTEQVFVEELDFSITDLSCHDVDAGNVYTGVRCRTIAADSATYPDVKSGNRLVERRIIAVEIIARAEGDTDLTLNESIIVNISNDSVLEKP